MSNVKTLQRWDRRVRIEAIRQIALDQFADPKPGFSPYTYLGELKAMQRRRHSPLDLEARILLNVGASINPTRTKRYINYLRSEREKAGQIEEFHAFDRLLRETCQADDVLAQAIPSGTFATISHDDVWADVRKRIGYLLSITDDVFLNSGTLLGVTRDRALIGHDYDIDLAVRLGASSHAEAAQEWEALKAHLRQHDLVSAKQHSGEETIQLKSAGRYPIDLMPSWVVDKRVYVYPHTFGEMTEDEVFPLATCSVTGLPIPRSPEKMLRLNYGEGWQTPDPYFLFPWSKARAKFSVFLEALG